MNIELSQIIQDQVFAAIASMGFAVISILKESCFCIHCSCLHRTWISFLSASLHVARPGHGNLVCCIYHRNAQHLFCQGYSLSGRSVLISFASPNDPGYVCLQDDSFADKVSAYQRHSKTATTKSAKMTRIVEGRDVVIFATGAMVWKSYEAALQLKDEGISGQTINVSTLKPLKKEEILKYVLGATDDRESDPAAEPSAEIPSGHQPCD